MYFDLSRVKMNFKSTASRNAALSQPRATTAACEVIPPRVVRIPLAAIIPSMSSGLVSVRTRTTDYPRAVHSAASFAVNTTRPTAAPGDAARPVATTSYVAVSSKT